MFPMSYQLIQVAQSVTDQASPSFTQEIPTMVYVGHICSRVSDESLKDLLSLCGDIEKWTRQSDPVSGEMVHFGFCEFRRIEGAMRALDFLDGQSVGSKKLVVKVDTKISDKIDALRTSFRLNQQTEDRIRSTVLALLTTINQKWREEAIMRDTEPVVPERPLSIETTVIPNTENDVLPASYRESRRERDRLRAIERRRQDRESDFRKALEEWERGPERRFMEEIEDESQIVKESLAKKLKLIDQDGVDGFKVRSNFTLADRKREIDFDLKDKIAEERELAEKRHRDLSQLEELKSQVSRIFASSYMDTNQRVVIPPALPSTISEKVRTRVRRLPKNMTDIEIFQINWNKIESENVLRKKLHPWLLGRLVRTCRVSIEAAEALTKYIVKTIEVKREPLLSEILFNLSSVIPNGLDGIDDVCVRAYQLLTFSAQEESIQ